MHRALWICLVGLLCILMAACTGLQLASTIEPTTEPEKTVVQAIIPTPTPAHPAMKPSPGAPPSQLIRTSPPEYTPTAALTLITATPVFSTTFQICSPLEIHPLEELPEIISDPYRPPPPGREERHHGVDFSYYRRGDRLTIQGVGVQAVLSGQIAAAIQDRFPYGNVVIVETGQNELPAEWISRLGIKPGESIYTLYAHLDQPPQLSLGDRVEACQSLGAVGKSGNTVEPHLHLEMRLGPAGQSFPSMAYYGAKDSKEERENYVRWRTGGEFRHFDPMSVLGKTETP